MRHLIDVVLVPSYCLVCSYVSSGRLKNLILKTLKEITLLIIIMIGLIGYTLIFNVPFEKKDKAKKHGLYWNPSIKKWNKTIKGDGFIKSIINKYPHVKFKVINIISDMFDKDAKQKKQLMKYYTNDYNNKYERIRKEKQIKKELFEQRRITKKEEHDRLEKTEESYEMKYENMKQTYNKVNRMVTTAQYISMIIKNKTWLDVHICNQTIKLEDGKTIIKNDFDII